MKKAQPKSSCLAGPFGFSQQRASWLGFWSVGAGAFAGVVLGAFADRFRRRMKLLISSAETHTFLFLSFCPEPVLANHRSSHNMKAQTKHCFLHSHVLAGDGWVLRLLLDLRRCAAALGGSRFRVRDNRGCRNVRNEPVSSSSTTK
jgi:nitrate/nitrite transporter NarK